MVIEEDFGIELKVKLPKCPVCGTEVNPDGSCPAGCDELSSNSTCDLENPEACESCQ